MGSSKKRATDVEKLVYRFLLSIVIGFFVGCYVGPSLHPIAYHVLPRSWCPLETPGEAPIYIQARDDQPKVEKDGMLGSIYIGMMSMEEKLPTRTQAALGTWGRGKHPKVRVEVFANNNGTIDPGKRFVSSYIGAGGGAGAGVRVIQLPGVKDTDYPPQKKSFSMIKFMHDEYLDSFDWFVRLDDDAYVDTKKMHDFLSGVDASKPWFIGSAGFGKNSDDWIAKGENYCMGGPGVIMSKALLRRLGPRLGACLQILYTAHEDIELGRCVQKMTGIKCTQAWETKKLFFQNYQQGSYAPSIEEVEPAQLDKGIVFHANKEPTSQFNFHNKVIKRRIVRLMDRVAGLEKELRMLGGEQQDPDASSRAQFEWRAIMGRNIFTSDEKNLVRHMRDPTKQQLIEGTNLAVREVQKRFDNTKTKLSAVGFVQSYHVINPSLSVDTVSHVTCTYTSKGSDATSAVERPIHTRQYFIDKLRFVKEESDLSLAPQLAKIISPGAPPSEQPPVNFVMTLSGRPQNFVRFINNFESTFLARGERVNLFLAYFPEARSAQEEESVKLRENYDAKVGGLPVRSPDERFIIENMSTLQQAYPGSQLVVVLMKPGTDFSRGLGLQTAAAKVTGDEILFFCDVDLVFAPEMLTHIRRNTIKGQQAFYPVFFSQYDPDVVYVEMKKPQSDFSFSELDGFWRHFSYGMVSLYKSDFARTKGFDLSIRGWGLEDIHLVNAILGMGLQVFKSTEPAEVHIFHDKFCSPTLSKKQYIDCLNSRGTHYGPRTLLYYLWKAPLASEDDVIIDTQ